MFGNMKNLGSLMAQAGQFREKAEEMKRELEHKTVEGEAGGGAVRVVMNGRAQVRRVEMDRNLILGLAGESAEDKEIVEELTAAAFNDGLNKVQELVSEEMQKLTGGLDIPGLSGMLGGPGAE